MADGHHSYILDAFGLIVLFAIAMIGISVPLQTLRISAHQTPLPAALTTQQTK